MSYLGFLVSSFMAIAIIHRTFGQPGDQISGWEDGRATFYGDIHGNETMCKSFLNIPK